MEHVVWLWSRGLTIDVAEGRLVVSPRDRITDEVRQRISDHRDAIIERLLMPDIWQDRREEYARLCRGEAA